MNVFDAHMVPTELDTYAMKVWLLDAPSGNGVTGLLLASINVFRSGRGETPATQIDGLISFTEVDATNMPGLYELQFDATTVASTLRGSCSVYLVNDGGTPFEETAVNFLLIPREAVGGTF